MSKIKRRPAPEVTDEDEARIQAQITGDPDAEEWTDGYPPREVPLSARYGSHTVQLGLTPNKGGYGQIEEEPKIDSECQP